VRTNLAALVADVLALDVKAVGLVVGRHGEFFGRPRGDEGDVWVGVDAVVSTEKSSLPKRKTNCFMSSGAFSLTSATPATACLWRITFASCTQNTRTLQFCTLDAS
jgi:hypothetical protein